MPIASKVLFIVCLFLWRRTLCRDLCWMGVEQTPPLTAVSQGSKTLRRLSHHNTNNPSKFQMLATSIRSMLVVQL